MENLFPDIHFLTTVSQGRLSSKHIDTTCLTAEVNQAAVHNTNFCISGSVDAFQRPPISDFARQNLFYIQDFDIFHYQFGSFTERSGFDSFLLLYTYDGSGSLTYEGKTYPLKSGDGFFINCMNYHLYKVEGNHWDTGILHINGILLPALYEMFQEHYEPIFHEELNGQLHQDIHKLLKTYQDPQYYRDWQASSCIDQLLNHLLILSHANNVLHDTPDNIRYLIKYIESNFAQPLTLDSLAAFANTSKFYLSREFKKHTGYSPNEYIISLRIERAKSLLKNTTLPVYAIAHEIGIHDINNFTNLFKKRVGMTPTQYRKYL